MTIEKAKELLPIIQAYTEGKPIQWFSNHTSQWIDYKPIDIESDGFRERYGYRIKPEPKNRPMTRGEVVYFVTSTPSLVCRLENGNTYCPAFFYTWGEGQGEDMEWAIISKAGKITDGWHKFEVEE